MKPTTCQSPIFAPVCFALMLLARHAGGQITYTPYTFKTIAGQPPSLGSADGTNGAAQFRYPSGIAADGFGNVYIADTSNDTIRKMTQVGTNWVVTTIAGYAGAAGSSNGISSNARFSSPNGLATDASGNLYVADTGNNVIRKLTFSGTNWMVTTLAGNPGVAGTNNGIGTNALFNQPYGVAVDAATNIYIADANNDTIRELTFAGGDWVVNTIAGIAGITGSSNSPNALFDFPQGIAVDGATNLYIADAYNNTIRGISLVGTNWSVSTLAGLAGSSGSANGTGSTARFSEPTGVAVDNAGNVYVADWGNCMIRMLVSQQGNWSVSTLAGQPNGGSMDGTNTAALLNLPMSLTANSAGNVFVADTYNHCIREMSPVSSNWVVTTAAGVTGSVGFTNGGITSARFSSPYGLALDSSSNLYVSDLFNNAVREISSGTNSLVTTLAHSFHYPNGLAFDSAGNLYVADSYNNSIDKMTLVGTNWQTAQLSLPVALNDPNGVAVDSATNVYVADSGNNLIRKLTKNGSSWAVTNIAGAMYAQGSADGPGNIARFRRPTGIALDTAGNLYVADDYNDTIRKITQSGTNWSVSTIAGTATNTGFIDGTNTFARFNQPYAVVADASSNLYVSDTFNNAIRKITPFGTNWITTTIAGNGNFGVSDGTGPYATFYHPIGIILDSMGDLYVADYYNNTIRKGMPAVLFPMKPSITANGLSMTITGPWNRTVVIQTSTNLTDWQPIYTNVFSANGTLNFTDTGSSSFPSRYYRAVLQ